MDLTNYLNIHSPGYVIDILKDNEINELVIGNRQILPDIKEVTEDTLYDIASLTKVYTSTLVYIAYEENKIDLNSYIYDIDNNFVNLKNITVLNLLSHNQNIWTNGYLGDSKSKEEFLNILYTAYVKEDIKTYVDTHYIILGILLEKIYNKSYEELINEKILNKLNLKHTTFNPKDNIASNNYENGVDNQIYPGLIHDTKGRVGKKLGITTGHASIFTTANDLLLFLRSFLDNSLLKLETINLMLEHQDIELYNHNRLKSLVEENEDNIMYDEVLKLNPKFNLSRTINNMGVRYKNKIKKINYIPDNCSDNTIEFSGYTGPMFIIDFDKKVIIVIMCNVVHNTKLDRETRKRKTADIMNMVYDEYIK